MSHTNSDIVIAGGGVIGMAVAYFLSRETDASITVIDQRRPGTASWASAGGLWPIGESVGLGCGVIFFKTLSKRRRENPDEPIVLERPHQLPDYFLDFSLKSNAMFPDLWQELRQDGGVDFKLEKTGLKYLLFDEDDINYAKQIADSIPHLSAQLVWHSADDLRHSEPNASPKAIGALEFLRDDQVNPFLLTESYREGARRNGARIIDGTAVTGVGMDGSRVVSVTTDRGETHGCDLLINAGGAWAAELGRMVGLNIPVVPVKGQIVLSERLPKILKGCLSTSDCYMAQKDNGEILIGSTTEHVGFNVDGTLDEIRGLVTGAVKAIPVLRNLHIKRTWAGLRPGTPDEIPILGAVPGLDGYLNACGHFRTGIVASAITGDILSKLVLGRPLPVDLTPFLLERFAGKNIDELIATMTGGHVGHGAEHAPTESVARQAA